MFIKIFESEVADTREVEPTSMYQLVTLPDDFEQIIIHGAKADIFAYLERFEK